MVCAADANDASQAFGEASLWDRESLLTRWLLPVLIFLVAFGLRLAPLNRYVTPDEPAWVYRSIRFSQALASGNLAEIPATGHPGVTTMWLGSLGVQIHRWLAPHQAAVHLDWLASPPKALRPFAIWPSFFRAGVSSSP